VKTKRSNQTPAPSQAAIERDHERLFEAARIKRLHNPSMRDRALIEMLDAMGLKRTREYRLGTSLYSIAFYLEEHRLGIEIAPVEPGGPRDFKRRDALNRKRSLCTHLGIQMLTVDPVELDGDPANVAKGIEAALQWARPQAA
jgi:hypothetical protein